MLRLTIANQSSGEWPVPLSAVLVQEWRDHDGQLCAFAYAERQRGWLEWPGLTTFTFEEGREEVTAIPCPGATAQVIEQVFRRNAAPLIFQAVGWEALHASAVVVQRGVVGFCGSPQAGTSPLAYSLSRLGYRQCADGALVMDLRGAVRVEPLPFTSRFDPFVAATSTSLVDAASRRGSPGAPNPAERLYALFVLARGEGATPRLTRLPNADAFPAVMGHAYCFNPVDDEAKRRLVANYFSLVSQVPVFRLECGGERPHLDQIARMVLGTVDDGVLVRAAR